MAVIGKLIREGDDWKGRLRTLSFALRFGLAKREERRGDDAPDFDVIVLSEAGPVAVGVAWLRAIKRGDQAGKQMLSLAMDDPSWPNALNVNCYPDGAAGSWDIVWRRERRDGADG